MDLRTISERKYGMASKNFAITHGSVFSFGGARATVIIHYLSLKLIDFFSSLFKISHFRKKLQKTYFKL